jgi:hypothetical protein
MFVGRSPGVVGNPRAGVMLHALGDGIHQKARVGLRKSMAKALEFLGKARISEFAPPFSITSENQRFSPRIFTSRRTPPKMPRALDRRNRCHGFCLAGYTGDAVNTKSRPKNSTAR